MLKQLILIFTIVSISAAKIVEYQPSSRHWRILDFVFAQKYDLINSVNLMNFGAATLNNAVAQHESDVWFQKSWCESASISYRNDVRTYINNVNIYAFQKGYPGLVAYMEPLAVSVGNEAGRELQKVADTLDKELNAYQRTMAAGFQKQQIRFNEEVEKSMNTIGDEAKNIDDAKCVDKALRKVSRTLEEHHEAYTVLLKDEIKNPSSWFATVDEMKLLSKEFDTKVTSKARKCIEDGWLNAQTEKEIQPCLDEVSFLKNYFLLMNVIKIFYIFLNKIIGAESKRHRID